jgi:hypothetical protein
MAEAFVAEHGDTFVIEEIHPFYMNIRSVKTQSTLMLDVIDDVPCIDGVAVDWGVV